MRRWRRSTIAASRSPAGVRRTPLYGSYRTSPDSDSAFTMVVAVPGTTPSTDATWPIGTSASASSSASCDW